MFPFGDARYYGQSVESASRFVNAKKLFVSVDDDFLEQIHMKSLKNKVIKKNLYFSLLEALARFISLKYRFCQTGSNLMQMLMTICDSYVLQCFLTELIFCLSISWSTWIFKQQLIKMQIRQGKITVDYFSCTFT